MFKFLWYPNIWKVTIVTINISISYQTCVTWCWWRVLHCHCCFLIIVHWNWALICFEWILQMLHTMHFSIKVVQIAPNHLSKNSTRARLFLAQVVWRDLYVSSWLLDWWIEWTGHFLMQKIHVLLLSLSCFINHVHCTIKHILLDRSWLYLFQEINLRFKKHWGCKTWCR